MSAPRGPFSRADHDTISTYRAVAECVHIWENNMRRGIIKPRPRMIDIFSFGQWNEKNVSLIDTAVDRAWDRLDQQPDADRIIDGYNQMMDDRKDPRSAELRRIRSELYDAQQRITFLERTILGD